MAANVKPDAKLEKLLSLKAAPREQALYAVELLKSERKRQTLEAALRALTDYPLPEARPALLALYRRYEADGTKLDSGAFLRATILKALHTLAVAEDLPLLERAACTYEKMPSLHDAQGAHLRAAALKVLFEVDETIAAFHCTRLLADPETSRMSGEPALTAVKLLAMQHNLLPLYYYAIQEGEKIAEITAECLRSLTRLPVALVDLLVQKYGALGNEALLIGLFDLLLTHVEGSHFHPFLLNFLAVTRHYDLYRYLALGIVAGDSEDLLKEMLAASKTGRDKRKTEILREVLLLYRHQNPAIRAAINELLKPAPPLKQP
ncbi:MAG: hypothetical protein HXX08_22440 [Chloroflexi bacterium]|uniref:Uncharacterized protein n=1 Tax=Candidatus Chlorohelix allophototropha TaxID=3003348 RepID=A0A8T7M8Y4_9CHLR|nr:hypothetical protein [Chloroflexota bacterium]WJW68558.1 hypothetical protein OZ401_004172 [Chloroflexota bacterium L227-S17]